MRFLYRAKADLDALHAVGDSRSLCRGTSAFPAVLPSPSNVDLWPPPSEERKAFRRTVGVPLGFAAFPTSPPAVRIDAAALPAARAHAIAAVIFAPCH